MTSRAAFAARITHESDEGLADLLERLQDGEGVDTGKKIPLVVNELYRRPLARWLIPGETMEASAWVALARQAIWGEPPATGDW